MRSVHRWYLVKTTEVITKQLTLYISLRTLVFLHQKSWSYTNDLTLNGAPNAREVENNFDFRPPFRYIS